MKSKPKGANCLKTFTGKAKHIKLKRSIIIIDEIESRREGRYGEGRLDETTFPFFISPCHISSLLLCGSLQ